MRIRENKYWTVPEIWPGETAWIVGGGPSLRFQDLVPLAGRKVIVLNSSYETVPDANICLFGDARWYQHHKNKPEFQKFNGVVVGATRVVKMLDARPFMRLRKYHPNDTSPAGWCPSNDGVVMGRTVLQAALNLSGHLGVARCVLLGIDMGRGANGVSHHHSEHPWKNRSGNKSWDRQMKQLEMIAGQIKKRHIEVVNASHATRLELFPRIELGAAYANY